MLRIFRKASEVLNFYYNGKHTLCRKELKLRFLNWHIFLCQIKRISQYNLNRGAQVVSEQNRDEVAHQRCMLQSRNFFQWSLWCFYKQKKKAQNYFKEITKCVLGHQLLKYMTLSSPIIVNILSKECLGDKTQKIRQLGKFWGTSSMCCCFLTDIIFLKTGL